MGNFVYIDNQNLYVATRKTDNPWNLDMQRLHIYLREKYHATKAYLFMGSYNLENKRIYDKFQSYGYVVSWRPHDITSRGNKKGNVDTDIVFEMLKDAYESNECEKAILISGDGDYYRTVNHLISRKKFQKIILPSHNNASFLYKNLEAPFRMYLDEKELMKKLSKR